MKQPNAFTLGNCPRNEAIHTKLITMDRRTVGLPPSLNLSLDHLSLPSFRWESETTRNGDGRSSPDIIFDNMRRLSPRAQDPDLLHTSTVVEVIHTFSFPGNNQARNEMVTTVCGFGEYIHRRDFVALMDPQRASPSSPETGTPPFGITGVQYRREIRYSCRRSISEEAPATPSPRSNSIPMRQRHKSTPQVKNDMDHPDSAVPKRGERPLSVRILQENPTTVEKVRNFVRIAAYADQWKHKPVFILSVTLIQFVFWGFHYHHFKTHAHHQAFRPEWDFWTGPYQRCSKWAYIEDRRHEIWRFLSYIFVHSGLRHFVMNAVFQLALGCTLEASQGWLIVGSIYLAGGLAGSLSTSIFHPSGRLVGASPAVMSLAGAHIASSILNWNEDRVIILASRMDKATWWKSGLPRLVRLTIPSLLLFINILFLCLFRGNHPTLYMTHVTGVLSGIATGLILVRNRRVEDWEQKLVRWARAIVLLLGALAVFWNVYGDDIWMGQYEKRYFPQENYGNYTGHHGDCHYDFT